MKNSILVIVVGICFCGIDAYAGPHCTAGCQNYLWSAEERAFSCGTGTCNCIGAQTYPCYAPCSVGDNGVTCRALKGCTAYSTGYEKCTEPVCTNDFSNGSCDVSIRVTYRCAVGYYGTTTNGTSGCARCPSSGGIYGTSPAGSSAITSCYIKSGESGTDASGSYIYTDNCYYTN